MQVPSIVKGQLVGLYSADTNKDLSNLLRATDR